MRDLFKDNKAASMVGGILVIIGFAVSMYVVAYAIPYAIANVTAYGNASEVDLGTGASLWGLLPLIAVVVIIVLFLKYVSD